MNIQLEIQIEEVRTTVLLKDLNQTLTIFHKDFNDIDNSDPYLYVLWKDRNLVHMGEDIGKKKFDTLMTLAPFIKPDEITQETYGKIFETLGYHLQPQKSKSAKVQHRFSKAISEMEFYVQREGSKGVAIWQKRNEILLKAGAVLKREVPLKKDGTVGLDGKWGQTLRSEFSDKINDFVTTEDIILKSVNELGLFLYFGGTNSWLELKDENGKTIDEWTRVD